MKKIDFVNGTTIDGAKTFNDMQSNVEEVFNGAEPMGSIVVEDIIGKNLFDKNNNIQSGSFTDTGVIDASSDKFVQLSYIPVESSKNYILHAGTVPDRLVICEYDSNKNFIKRNISLGTYTLVVATTSTTKYVRVCSNNSVLDTLQFEKGNERTEYTPYKKFGYNKDESMGKIKVDGISGSNLLPISESETITLSKSFYFDEPLQPGTYRISVDSVSSTGTKGVYLFNFTRSDGVDGYYFYLEDGNLTEAVTIGAECKGVTIYSQQDWATSNGKTTTFNKAMITKGSSSTKYVPYTKYGYNKDKNMGKILVGDISCNNLFNKYGSLSDYAGWTSGATTLQSNGTIKATANMANGNGKGQFINVKPNTKYTMSFRVKEMETTGSYSVRIITIGLETNSTLYTYENTSTGYKTFTFTTNECNTIWVSICGINNVSSVNTFKYVIYDEFQLEQGSIATEYVPYKEFGITKRNFYNDSLLNSNYCGGSTNLKEMYLYNNGLVVINFSVILNNIINANTSTQLVNIPSELLPSKNVSLMTVNINKEGKEIAYINSGEGKIRWRSSVNAVAGDEIYIQGTYVKDEGLSTSTQSASTMSLRPGTTEEEIIEETE